MGPWDLPAHRPSKGKRKKVLPTDGRRPCPSFSYPPGFGLFVSRSPKQGYQLPPPPPLYSFGLAKRIFSIAQDDVFGIPAGGTLASWQNKTKGEKRGAAGGIHHPSTRWCEFLQRRNIPSERDCKGDGSGSSAPNFLSLRCCTRKPQPRYLLGKRRPIYTQGEWHLG